MTKNPIYFENRLNVCLLAAERSWIEANLQISQLQHKAEGSNIDLEIEMPIAADVKMSLLGAKQGIEAARRVAREARGYLADHPESIRYEKGAADRIIAGFGQLEELLKGLEHDVTMKYLSDRTQEMDRCLKKGDAARLAELFHRMWWHPRRWEQVRKLHHTLHDEIFGPFCDIDPW